MLGNSLTVWGMSRRSPIGVGDDGYVGGRAPGLPDQVLNDVGRVNYERRGAVRAATATRPLRFLGFARNDIRALGITVAASRPRKGAAVKAGLKPATTTRWSVELRRPPVFAWARATGFRIKSGKTRGG